MSSTPHDDHSPQCLCPRLSILAQTPSQPLPIQQQDQQLTKISAELVKLVRMVLPTPDLPIGWETSDALELISQWFELRLKVMEKTYYDLGFHKLVLVPPPASTTATKPSSGFDGPVNFESENPDDELGTTEDAMGGSTPSASTSLPAQIRKLTPDQLLILNNAYAENVSLQVDTFCVEKGISSTFITFLNKCLVNEPQLHATIAQYRQLQKERFTPLGIDLK